MRDPLSSRADSPAVHLAAAGTSGASLQIPSTDGILFALLTLGHEIFLHKRVQAAGQPGLFEILVLALGVGLSLGGLAWWTTPGALLQDSAVVAQFCFRIVLRSVRDM